MKQPIIIGIAGPSGSGKSAVAAKLEERLDCKVFHSDGYFNDPLPTLVSPDDGETYPDWNQPGSVCWTRLIEDIKKEAAAALHPYILVEGVLLFSIEELRELLDYRIFVTAKIETCLYRRIVRNISLFNQTPAFIGSYYLKCARHQEAKYCLPTIRYADFVIDNDISFEGQLEKLPFLKAKGKPLEG